jgi:hypothetical protein
MNEWMIASNKTKSHRRGPPTRDSPTRRQSSKP